VAQSSLRFLIDAEYAQFNVQDVDPYDAWMAEHAMDPGLKPGGWTGEAVQIHRIGLEPFSISVGTARDDIVESLITVHTSEPTPEPEAEHIVEADLDVPTGVLSIFSIGDAGHTMTVPAGPMRVRVSHIPSEPPADDTDRGPGDHFLYRVDLWPTDRARELIVTKQGPSHWAL
jgi:hypothetical protein